MLRRTALVAAVAAASVALSAAATAQAAPARDVQITSRMKAFAAARTPAAACKTMSSAFQMHLGGGSTAKCATGMPASLARFVRTHKRGLKIVKLGFTQGQGVVTARIGGGAATKYYFDHQRNGWWLNSIGAIQPHPPGEA